MKKTKKLYTIHIYSNNGKKCSGCINTIWIFLNIKKNSIRNFLIEKNRKKTKAKKLSFVHSNKKKFVCTLLVKQKKILFFLLSLFQK